MDKCFSDAVKAVAFTFHLQALKTSEDYHRLPANFQKKFSYYIARSLKILGYPASKTSKIT